MFGNSHKQRSLFASNVQFIPEKSNEPLPLPEFIPQPKTKAEAKQLQKYVFLPGERLAISMAKQEKKDKIKRLKEKAKLKKNSTPFAPSTPFAKDGTNNYSFDDTDINNISSSVSRILSNLFN